MNKSIIITGATGNLGSAVSSRMLADGYTLYTTLVPGKKAPADQRIHGKALDLMDENQCSNYIKEITDSGADISAAVLLVGGFAMGDLANTTTEGLDKMFKLNFYTAFPMVKTLFAYFERKGGGQIILVGARPALVPSQGKGVVAYALSKGLIFHLAELVNETGKAKNIRATVIVPSTIDTAINRQSMPDADFTHWVPAERIADVIAFLLTDGGSMLRESVMKVYNQA